jgi:hypothetical protein
MLSDVIQNKRDRSMMSQGEDFNRSLWLRDMCQEPQEVEENVIVPVRMGVKETVKLIESTYQKGAGDSSPPRMRRSVVRQTAHEETQTEGFEIDEVNNCLMKASESIQKLDEMLQMKEVVDAPQNFPTIPNRRVETLTNPQTPKSVTTKVTVNLKQISRRSSDVSHLKQMQELNRQSVCSNSEFIKRIQMHFRSKKNDEISASCSSLATKSNDVGHHQKCSKYFCRNCGFTMLPAEVMQKIQSTGRLSIASSLAEGLQSIEGSQSMASIRRCLPINVSNW